MTSPLPYLVGIDMGGTAIKAAAFSLEGERLAIRTAPTADGGTIEGRPAWAVRIRYLVAEFAAELGSPAKQVGLAAPGIAADNQRSVAVMWNRLAGIEGFDWSEWLGTPVPVLNDAHAALLGEVWQGAARNRRNAVMLTLGTGVGGAVLVEGRLLRGTLGRAGHLGHATVDHEAKDASIFGMPGSLEMAVGNCSVAARSGGRFQDSRLLVEAAMAGDALAAEVWDRSVHSLGCAISSFINIFDPEIVVLGGGIAESGPALWTPLEHVLDVVEWRPFGGKVPVVGAELGGWAGAYGAAFEALRYGGNE